MLAEATYERLRAEFAWRVPARINIGVACADAQPPDALALVDVAADGSVRELTFGQLAELSNRLANALRARGVGRGDRVAIVLPQRAETGLTHLAVYKLGAVAVPMSTLFGPDALAHRLDDSGARVVVTDEATRGRVEAADVLTVERDLDRLVGDASPGLEPAPTGPDDPALLIYTSGTTGPPKGALHGHRVLFGHLPGFELSHDGFPQDGDRFWSPADWAWIGGLLDALLPTWFHGRAIVAAPRAGFDPEWAVRILERHGVRNAFFPPTALKLMRNADVRLAGGTLRSAMSGGEVLGEEMLAWGRERLGVTINEIYGQTEANYVVGNSQRVWPVRPGSMGRPYPGHEVAVRDGEIAVRLPDPVAFLEYWRNPEATLQKAPDGWLRTGDLAEQDDEGYLWFRGRADDVITSSGYRIGPEEIEQCLLRHPAVALSAAIGVPDPVRGEAIKAFVRLADGHDASPELEAALRDFVRTRLAAYEYPRQIEFVDELPLTVTGKIRRSELRRLEEERRKGGS